MVQRRQDIISEGDCGNGCDNDGVHKGLVIIMVVTRSLISLLLSTLLLFPYLRVGGQAFGGFDVVGTPSRRVRKWAGIGGWLEERVVWFLCGRICRSRWLCSCIEAGFHLSRKGFWREALVPGGGELRFPKTIPRGDIGI